ncbi:MAG: hypothetical protein B7C54_03775 [Acidimicrobiales bacterium mtb01]|nr:hypothetical protein [Actinomycetota bacterium]TEX47406.1 MAG: hypothetical protein B7C54_03775 [Acidimicrobiales bacterium mtb01]
MRTRRLATIFATCCIAVGLTDLAPQAASAVPTPRLVRASVNDRFIDVDASNDGLVAYTVAARIASSQPQFNAKVLKTADGGLEWTELSSSPSGYWTAVATSSSGQVVALVGKVDDTANGHRLFVSTDSGVTWIQKGSTDSAYLDVAVSANGSVIAVAQAYSGISTSSDGGDNWTIVDLDSSDPDPQPLLVQSVALSNDGSVIAASTYGGSVWRSVDSGSTWVDIKPGSEQLWQDLVMSDDGLTIFGVVFDDRGYIWDGNDSPATWNDSGTPGAAGSLDFANGQAVRAAISPDGNTFIAASYGRQPRILRNWDRESPLTWQAVPAGTAVLGLTVTNGGSRFMTVNEGSGIWAYVPETPAPIASSVSTLCGGDPTGPTEGGVAVEIQGAFLFDVSSVTFGGTPATVVDSEIDGSEVRVIAPPGSTGAVDVVVTTPSGSVTLVGAFTYQQSGGSRGWSQIGATITSAGSDEYLGELFGKHMDLNDDGTVIAIGSVFLDDDDEPAGRARVFDWTKDGWVQRGLDIVGDSGVDDATGWSVALSADGDLLAVSDIGYDEFTGRVRIFSWDGDAWTQVGADLVGADTQDYFGWSLSANADGDVIAIGSLTSQTNPYAGSVSVFDRSGNSWIRREPQLFGSVAQGFFGFSLALDATGDVLAVGAAGLGADSSGVSVWKWQGSSWIPRGASILDEQDEEFLGWSVDLSADGDVLAAGAPQHDNVGDGEMPLPNSGLIRVYDWTGTNWSQVRAPIPGTKTWSNFGRSVSLSADGVVVAGGAPNDGTCETSGSAAVLAWENDHWAPRGGVIRSDSQYGAFGASVELDSEGKVLAVNAPIGMTGGATFVFRYSPEYQVFLVPPSPPTTPPTTGSPPTITTPSTNPPTIVPNPEKLSNLPILESVSRNGTNGQLNVTGSASRGSGPTTGTRRFDIRSGDRITVSINNFLANEDVWIGFYSDPLTVTRVRANASGTVEASFTAPTGIAGDHTMVVYGTESGRGLRVLTRFTSPRLPRTGSEPAWPLATGFLMVGLLCAAIASNSRRRNERRGIAG